MSDPFDDEILAAFADYGLAELIEELIGEKARGPVEDSGYTDNAHYCKLDILRKMINAKAAPNPEDINAISEAGKRALMAAFVKHLADNGMVIASTNQQEGSMVFNGPDDVYHLKYMSTDEVVAQFVDGFYE